MLLRLNILRLIMLAAAMTASISAHASSPELTLDGSIVRMDQAGRYQDLKDYIEQRIAEGLRQTATPLSYLCLAYGKLKLYAQLEDCLGKLEQQVEAGDWQIQPVNHLLFDTAGDARPLLDVLRAESALEFGDYRKAIAAAENALNEIPKYSSMSSPPFPPIRLKLTVLPVLITALVGEGEIGQARKYLKELESVERPFGGSGIWDTLRSNGLGRSYMALRQYGSVIAELESARKFSLVGGFANLFTGIGATKRDDSFLTIYELPRQFMLGKAYMETGRIDKAKAALDMVLASPRSSEMGDLYWLTLFERGRVAESEQNLSAATKFYEDAVRVVESQRASIHTEASKIGFVGDKQAVYDRLISVLVRQGRPAEAFDYVERSKSRALVDMLASKKSFAVPANDPEKVKQILAQLDAAEMASRSPVGSTGGEAGSMIRNLNLVQQKIRIVSPELSSLVTVSAVPSDELKKLVKGNEALVEYYYQGGDFYVFVLNRQQLQVIKLVETGLVEQVQAFRTDIEGPSNNSWQTQSQALYKVLWQPLEGALHNANEVIVVPHGVLHYLPFAALQEPDGTQLIDHYGIRILPNASLLKLLAPAMPKTDAPLLVLGNPDLSDARLDLQFAESEAKLVAGMVPGSRLLLRKQASETNLKNAGSIFSRIHFATHGKFQADKPLESGLYLAKDADNDGVLTVGELYSMQLDADLVTLSACETGLGKVANGDDVVGLTRGFLYAGTRSIVASLWSVDDRATSVLMESFYANLSSMNKEDALRQAQLKTRQKFPAPFYWAAFQLTGRSD